MSRIREEFVLFCHIIVTKTSQSQRKVLLHSVTNSSSKSRRKVGIPSKSIKKDAISISSKMKIEWKLCKSSSLRSIRFHFVPNKEDVSFFVIDPGLKNQEYICFSMDLIIIIIIFGDQRITFSSNRGESWYADRHLALFCQVIENTVYYFWSW